MAFPGLGEDSSDSSSSSDEEDEAQRRAAWQKVLDNIAAEAEELGGRYREARGPRARKRRPHEAPGTRDARFSHQFPRRDERCRRFDHSASPWWELMRHPDVYDESSAAGRRYRRKFRMPKVKVDELVAEASKQSRWADKPPGPGHGRGPARAPLVLKVMAALVRGLPR